MSEWWSYRLSDFLMFSPGTYWRMVERYNREMWPLQAVMAALGLWLLWMVAARRPMAGRAVACVLAAISAWVGWAFHWQRYAQINWAAEYFAAAFGVQALLLLGAGLHAKPNAAPAGNSGHRIAGLSLAAAGVLLYPFIVFAMGRGWAQAEFFGLMPEPTALATLGLLVALRARHLGWLAIIPAVSLMAGIATWWMLQGVQR